jgi:hypothetical protein
VEALAERATSGFAHEREALDHAIVVTSLAQRQRAPAQLVVGECLKLRLAARDRDQQLGVTGGWHVGEF